MFVTDKEILRDNENQWLKWSRDRNDKRELSRLMSLKGK